MYSKYTHTKYSIKTSARQKSKMEEEGKMDDYNNNDNTIEEEEEEEGKVEENQIRRYDVTFTQGFSIKYTNTS